MNPTAKILLVEDDPNLGYMTQEGLELQNFSIVLARDGDEGLALFLKQPFDLCLIDVMLPKKDGFSLAKAIRKVKGDLPIIFLTAKSLKEDKIEGLRIGADDYITKPFSMEELVLRMQAVLRRSRKMVMDEPMQHVFEIGEYRFNADEQTLHHAKEKRKLTHRESELLRLLCMHQEKILERETALKLIWEEDTFFNSRSMDVYLSKLRKYLNLDQRVAITNQHGKGFRLHVGK
jgi:DNA-binding response OmpR family regulator